MIDKSLFRVTGSLGSVTLFSLAIPLLLESILNNLLGTVSTLVLSSYSEEAVAAVGAANSMVGTFGGFFSVIAFGATVRISNYIGAEKLESAKEGSFVTVVLCGCVGLVSSLTLCYFRRPILAFMNLEKSVLEGAMCYFGVRMGFFVFSAISSAFSSILRCYGHATSTVIGGLTTNVINIILSVFVVYFPQYSPVTGVLGVALACVTSQLIGMLIFVGMFRHFRMGLKRPASMGAFWTMAGRILRIGIPTGLSNSSFALSQTISTAYIAMLGTYAINSRIYFTTIFSYVYLFSGSLGNANSLLVGRLYGAGNMEQADRANRQLVKITVVVNMLLSLMVIFLRVPLLSLFTDDPRIIALFFGVALIDILAEQARAVSQVYEYALRATGDVLFTVVILIVSCWSLSIGLSYYLSIHCGLGLLGCWIGLALDESVRAITTFFRWRYRYKRHQQMIAKVG